MPPRRPLRSAVDRARGNGYNRVMTRMRCVVAGGGAAGFFGAIACAETNPDAEVLLLEKSPELLAKVTISGGGRCNVTHHCFDVDRLVEHYPRGGRELRGPFHRWQPRDTVAWFERRGVALKVEPDGRMFPVTDSSATIVQCLTSAARSAGVQVTTSRGLQALAPRGGGGLDVTLTTGERLTCERVLLASGGNKNTAGYRLAASVGHTIEPPVPSLFTFHIPDPELHARAGIAVPDAEIRAPGHRLCQSGPLLVTHWGLSGPAVLKLSAWGARAFANCGYAFDVDVAWVRRSRAEVDEALRGVKRGRATAQVATTPLFELPGRLWELLARRAGVAPGLQWARLSRALADALGRELTACRFRVDGKSLFKEEFVTCGGICLREVDFKTLESRRCPGLHFAGEVLDIDAVTGGFNFQAAWTTGWIAGRAMAGAT
jgi:predicted Rossmann fold flavoprotein